MTLKNNFYLIQKQKNISCVIGANGDLIDLFSLNKLFSINGNSLNLIYDDNTSSSFIDFPCFYRSNFSINKNKNFNNIFILGSNPRYENSAVQLYLRNMTNENTTNIFTLNNYNRLTFRNKTIGTSNNSFINIFEGKEKFLLNFFGASKNLFINGYNSVNLKNKNCNIFQKQFLNLKLYSFTNEKNQFLDLSNNLTLLANNEFNRFTSSKNIINFDINKKLGSTNNIVLFQSNNVDNIDKNISTLYNFCSNKINNISFKNKIKKKNIKYVYNNFQKKSLIINFSGLLLKSNKVVQNQDMTKHNLFFLYKKSILKKSLNEIFLNEFNSLYKYNINTKKKSLNKYWFSSLFNINKNPINNIFNKNSLSNFFNKNLNKKYFTFWWFMSNVLTNNRIFFSNYTNSIKNYYLNDALCKNSYNMLLLSLLKNRHNIPF